MEELELCPFCGQKPWLAESDPFGRHREELYCYGVLCKCGAAIWKNRKEEVIEAWNRRESNG